MTFSRPSTWDESGWRDDAACRDTDPELFFPVGSTGEALQETGAAITLCQRCPVRKQCLEFAMVASRATASGGARGRRRMRSAWVAAAGAEIRHDGTPSTVRGVGGAGPVTATLSTARLLTGVPAEATQPSEPSRAGLPAPRRRARPSACGSNTPIGQGMGALRRHVARAPVRNHRRLPPHGDAQRFQVPPLGEGGPAGVWRHGSPGSMSGWGTRRPAPSSLPGPARARPPLAPRISGDQRPPVGPCRLAPLSLRTAGSVSRTSVRMEADPLVRWQRRWYLALVAASFAIPFALGGWNGLLVAAGSCGSCSSCTSPGR